VYSKVIFETVTFWIGVIAFGMTAKALTPIWRTT
jgi:hypothetical protein